MFPLKYVMRKTRVKTSLAQIVKMFPDVFPFIHTIRIDTVMAKDSRKKKESRFTKFE